MIKIKKMIINGYADFSKEVQNETKMVYKKGTTKTCTWAATITTYVTAKQFNRVFFDFPDNELEIKPLKKGNVINLRNERKIDNKYSSMFDQYFLIIDIDANEITLEIYPTVAKAVKAQKIMSYVVENETPVAVQPINFFSSNSFF